MIAAFFLGTGAAAFPQLFVLARRYLVGTRDIEHGTPVLRSTWSIAWAIGPVTGGALQAWQGFVGLFLAASLAFGLVALPVLMLGAGPGGEAVTAAPCGEPTQPDRSLLPVVISFTLFHTAMFSGSVILPLWMTQALHRPYSDVGLTFSVCAGVECLAALVVALRPPRIAKERVILLGMLLFVGYFALIAASSSIVVIVAAQAARGIAISIVLALGITYFQDLLPRQPGRATTLLSNTATAGSLLAGVLAGAIAQVLGYRAALAVCAVLSTAAWIALIAARKRGTRPSPERRLISVSESPS